VSPCQSLLWFAYPKGTSTKYKCDFNRDSGWDSLQKSGFDTVRQVASRSMKIGLPCDFVASNSSIIGQANRPACGTLLQRPVSGEQFRSATGRSWPGSGRKPGVADVAHREAAAGQKPPVAVAA
jgi:hypothetical protein